MGRCAACGDRADTTSCSYCGHTHCSMHRLPENHDCIGLYRSETHGPDFRHVGEDQLTKNPNQVCRGCGQAVKTNRRFCYRCRSTRAGSNRSDDSTKEKQRPDNAPNTCSRCGRATFRQYERCFKCRRDESGGPSRREPATSSPDVTLDGSIADRDDDTADESGSMWTIVRRGLVGASESRRYRGACPTCGGWVRKLSGQRITTCTRCGWKPGLPVVRLLTHYPPWGYYRLRTVSLLWTATKVALVATIVFGVIGGTVGTGIPAIDRTAADVVAAFNETFEESEDPSPQGGGDSPRPSEESEAVVSARSIDSDGDNLPNRQERELEGASPWRKDIFVTVLYGTNVEPLTDRQIADLERRFDRMPVENPNGVDGITFHLLQQESAGENIRWSAERFDTVRTEYYTRDRLDEWYCDIHMIVIGEDTEPEAWGLGASPGHFIVTNGTYDVPSRDGGSFETIGIVHELLHNVVGAFPARFKNVNSSSHTRSGYLSHSKSYDELDSMSDPTATLLSSRGFTEPAENVINAC